MPQNIGTTASPSQAGRGTLRSMPMNVSADANTGAAFVSFPLTLTQSRALTPNLSLNYHANQGNGIFGVGVDLSGTLNITRSTSRGGVPQYDESDIFILSNAGELVQVSNDATTVKYRPRLDTQFSDISYNRTTKTWLIREANGINHTLGSDAASQVTSPDGSRIYQWWVSETIDARGNKIDYTYTKTATSFCLHKVKYGNYTNKDGLERFAFHCALDYGDSDATQKDTTGQALWLRSPPRPDQFTHYRSGFAITVSQLCQRITLTHVLEGKEYLVKYWQLSYQPATTYSAVSLIQQIQEMGCRSNSQDQYTTQALPPTTLDFFLLKKTLLQMKPFALDQTPLPGTPGDYQWVDLYRDGLPGMLYNDGITAYYWRAEGNGTFSAPKPVIPFPSAMDFSSPTNCRIMHLGKEKKAAFVVADDQQAGYYLLDEEQLAERSTQYVLAFSQQQLFRQYPVEFTHPSNEVMDLNGNGKNDLVVLDTAYPCYYPESDTVGTGYEAPRILTLPADFPRHGLDPNSLVTFTDIFGDGLMHRVCINRDGINIWPNLGNGRFGEKIRWTLPAIQSAFDPGSVFLVDIDGTGASDFVYASSTGLQIFLNQGTQFASQAFSFSFPEKYTNQDQLMFSDILGTGLPSVIFIKKDINENRYYTGSFASQKPYLLQAVTQSSGLKINFSYETSAKAYLTDREKGLIPSIRLPFVLPVLSGMTTTDPLTKVTLTKTYDYHYGEYNFSERRFCGFAYVTETHHEEITNASTVIKPIQDRCIKTWFYNRASKDAETNFPSVQLGAGILPSDMDQHYYKTDETTDGVILSSITDNTLRQELNFALHGSVIRQETWAGQSDFFKGRSSLVSMTCNHYNLRCDRLPTTTQYGIIVLQERENVHLELDASDEPKITRDLHLRFDQYNHVVSSVTINYGRNAMFPLSLKDGVTMINKSSLDRLKPLQAAIYAVYHTQQFIPVNSSGNYRYLHLPSEQKIFDVSSLIQGQSTTAVFSTLQSALNAPTALVNHQRWYYWNDAQGDMAPFGSAGALGLLHHQRRLLGQDTQAQAWYAPLLQTNEALDSLLNQNGYLKDDTTRDWWQPEAVKYYSNAQGYYQITQIKHIDAYGDTPEESLFARTELSYDVYQQNVVTMTRYVNKDRFFSTRLLIDPQSMKPCQVIDENKNIHISLSDALGRPLAATYYGQLNGTWVGNPITNTPAQELTAKQLSEMTFSLIQQLSTITVDALRVSNASLDHWLELYMHVSDQQPHYTLTRLQSAYQTRAIAIAPAVAEPIHLEINYVDGLGRSLQTKKRTDKSDTDQYWLRSTTSLYSISGQLLHQFLPAYCSDSSYEAPVLSPTNKALSHEYDALLRLVQQTLPCGDRRQRVYSPWYHIDYDQNVMANKADATKSLPRCTIVHFQDSADHSVGHLKIGASNTYQFSSSSYDALGRPISHQDARLKTPNLTLTYNLLGQVIARHSVDRGDEHCLHHVHGMLRRRQLGSWTYDYTHDSAQRLLLTRVSSSTQVPTTIEERVYGDTQSSPETINAVGQLISFSNEKGVFKPLVFDLKGECIQHERTIFLPMGWAPETFHVSNEYNAFGQLVAESLPNGQLTVREYNPLAQLKTLKAGTATALSSVVSNMLYQEAGLRTTCKLGTQLNHVITSTYEYDTEKQRLVSVRSVDANNRLLQDQRYTFDPVGNIVSLDSKARQLQSSASNMLSIPSTTQHYQYDDHYRLTSADGLEMTAKPIGSDAKMISQQYFSESPTVQTYQQLFTYDNGDNLNSIKHVSAQPWRLDFAIQAESNQFATLTSTKDNHPVDLKGKALYDPAGNMQKLDETTDLTWDHTNQLSQSTVDRSATSEGQVKEYYGYRGTAFQDVPFSDNPGDRVAYTPGFFGSSRAAKHPTIDPKPFAEYGNRLYKITCFEKPGNTLEIIEQIFLGSYERKRIFTVADKTNMVPVNTLIRHTVHLHDDDVMMATHHQFELDINAREASQAVAAGTTPLEQWQYHLTNHLKSSVLSLDDQGNVLSFEGYQAYGQLGFIMTRDAKQLSLQNYHYSSEIRDEVTGLYYYGARSYAPQFGRWLSPDPAGLVDGLNLYGFVRNNPMSFWDCWGLIGHEQAQEIAKNSFEKINKLNLTTDIVKKILGKEYAMQQIEFVKGVFTGKDNREVNIGETLKDDKFRGKWTAGINDHLDEAFGVAAVREMCKNIFDDETGGAKAFMDDKVVSFFALASGFRLPTEMVGFNVKGMEPSILQHPTSKPAALYDSDKNPNHTKFDKERGIKAVEALEAGGDKGLLHALHATASFTVDCMAAPPLAQNNKVLKKHEDNNQKMHEYNQYREFFKEITDNLLRHIDPSSPYLKKNQSNVNNEWKSQANKIFYPRRTSDSRVEPMDIDSITVSQLKPKPKSENIGSYGPVRQPRSSQIKRNQCTPYNKPSQKGKRILK